MKLLDYLEARATDDASMAKEVEEYERNENEYKESTNAEIKRLTDENESLKETIDTLLTDVIPNLMEEV